MFSLEITTEFSIFSITHPPIVVLVMTKTTIGGCVIEKIENSVVISKENTK